MDFAERIAAISLFAPHFWVALEDEGAALGVVSSSGKRTLCLFRSYADAEEFAREANRGRHTIREMKTVGDMAMLFGSPNGRTYTHVTLNPPVEGSAFNVMEKDVYFDKAVEMSGARLPSRGHPQKGSATPDLRADQAFVESRILLLRGYRVSGRRLVSE